MAGLVSSQTVAERTTRVAGDAARRDLERQVAALEARYGALVSAARPRTELLAGLAPAARVAGRSESASGPRLPTVDALERTRDELARRILELERALDDAHRREREMRELRRRMLVDPRSCAGLRVTNADCGEPGCTAYRAEPRLGLLGLVFGWWRVKISSGCPLAAGRRGRSRGRYAGGG